MNSPFWIYDGVAWNRAPLRGSLRTVSAGIFVGRGPSLGKLDATALRGPGKAVFGVNNSYPTVTPDYWVGMDDPACYDQRIFHEPIPKFLRGGYQDRLYGSTPVSEAPNAHFIDLKVPATPDEFFLEQSTLVWHKNTMATTLHLMYHMGIRDMYLAGVDLDTPEYVDGQELSTERAAHNAQLYNELGDYLVWLSKVAPLYGLRIQSISPESPINNLFNYVPLEVLNQNLVLPEPGQRLHASDVEETRNGN